VDWNGGSGTPWDLEYIHKCENDTINLLSVVTQCIYMAIDCYVTPCKPVEDNKLTMICINLLDRANSCGIGAVNPGLGIVLVGVRYLVQPITYVLQ
jgi:hypothetical protein